jgi:hypothetical protein
MNARLNAQPDRAALPPYPTSAAAKLREAKAKLRSAIDRLIYSCGDATTLNLLAAIADCPNWDEWSDREFRQLGFSIAIELYDYAMMNADREEALNSPNNPRNWDGYSVDEEF